jgi:hypothetical protein
LRQGKKQIYGSQIARDTQSNKYYLSPLQDAANVDRRRAAVGLEPMMNMEKNGKLNGMWNNTKKIFQRLRLKKK